jgi:hypothetical protein
VQERRVKIRKKGKTKTIQAKSSKVMHNDINTKEKMKVSDRQKEV